MVFSRQQIKHSRTTTASVTSGNSFSLLTSVLAKLVSLVECLEMKKPPRSFHIKNHFSFKAMSYAAYFTNGSILVLAPMQETRLQAKAGREILS